MCHVILGNAYTPDRSPWTGDRERSLDGLFKAHALKNRVRTVLGQLAHMLDCLLATFAHDVGGSELLSERDPLRVAAEEDDPFSAEALRGDHAAESDSAVPHDGDGLAWTDLRRQRGVMTSSHDIGEREQRGHERVVWADRKNNEGPVSLRDPHRFALTAVNVVPAVPAAVQTLTLQSFPTEDTRAVRPEEG